ncbi:hypothetical protein [Bradyrhizobium sp. USDA 4353]
MTAKISQTRDVGTTTGSEKLACVSGGANKTITPGEIASYISAPALAFVN